MKNDVEYVVMPCSFVFLWNLSEVISLCMFNRIGLIRQSVPTKTSDWVPSFELAVLVTWNVVTFLFMYVQIWYIDVDVMDDTKKCFTIGTFKVKTLRSLVNRIINIFIKMYFWHESTESIKCSVLHNVQVERQPQCAG